MGKGKGRRCRSVERGWDGESAMRKSRTSTGDVRTRGIVFRIEGRNWCCEDEANREGGADWVAFREWRSVNGEINRREGITVRS